MAEFVDEVRDEVRFGLASAADAFAEAGSDAAARDAAERRLTVFAGALAFLDVGFDDDALWRRTRARFIDGALETALS